MSPADGWVNTWEQWLDGRLAPVARTEVLATWQPLGDGWRLAMSRHIGHNVRMGITVMVGRDGKLYPPEPLAEAELCRIRGLVHAFHCRDRQSIREVQQALLSYGVRRSVGAIWRDLHRYTCSLPRCPAVPVSPDPPERQPEPEPVRAAVHQAQAGGGLTGMVRDG